MQVRFRLYRTPSRCDIPRLADRDVFLAERAAEQIQHEGIAEAPLADLSRHGGETNGCGHGSSPTRQVCRVLMVV